MIIDAKGLIVGRLASKAAKLALLGEDIDIVNCDLAIVSGTKQNVFALYIQKRERGTFKGPFLHRSPDRIVRRTIRGMLPYKQPKGREAFERIMCHVGIPAEFAGKKMETVKGAEVTKLPSNQHVTIREICRKLGGKE
jgi:large subunit ribosomal protein L13